MARLIGRGRYARETYPQGSNGGSGPASLLALPWTPVTAGSTFQPNTSQPWLAVDTSGSTPVTIEMPAPAYDGMPLLVEDTDGDATANPILFTATGGVTIDDPMNPGNHYAATVSFNAAGGSVMWKFQALTDRWVLFTTPSSNTAATTAAKLQGTLFVDPQNVSGNASAAGPGTLARPFSSWAALVAAWGSLEATYNANTTVEFLSNSPSNGSDPVRWRPCITAGALLQIAGARGAAQVVGTGTITVTAAKSQVGAGSLLTVTFNPTTGPGIALGHPVVNTAKNSLAWPVANTSGNTWTMTQPVPLITPPHNNTSPGEDNSWANGDTFTCYQQVAIDIVDLQPVIEGPNGAFDNFLTVYACTALDTSSAVGAGVLSVKANTVSWYEVSVQRALTESMQTPPQLLRPGFFNCDIAGAVVLCQPNAWSGQYRCTLAVANFGGGGLLNDFVMANGVELFTGGGYGNVYLAAGKVLTAAGITVTANSGTPILYGPGGLNVAGNTHFTLPTTTNFVTAFQFTGGIQINAQGNALNGSPTVLPTGSFALTAANLDNAADFNTSAWVPGGGSITKLGA